MSTATQGEWRMADGELAIAGVHAAVGAQRPHNVLVQYLLKQVMHRHLMLLAG